MNEAMEAELTEMDSNMEKSAKVIPPLRRTKLSKKSQ